MVSEIEPRVGLRADSSEPGACFGFCVSLSLSAPPPLTLHLCLSKIKMSRKLKNKRDRVGKSLLQSIPTILGPGRWGTVACLPFGSRILHPWSKRPPPQHTPSNLMPLPGLPYTHMPEGPVFCSSLQLSPVWVPARRPRTETPGSSWAEGSEASSATGVNNPPKPQPSPSGAKGARESRSVGASLQASQPPGRPPPPSPPSSRAPALGPF